MNPYTTMLLFFFLGMNLVYFLLDILSQGFITTFLRIRFSRDRLCMVKIFSASRVYYKHGKETEGIITFKNSKKEDSTINADRDTFHRSMNINWVHYDEVKNVMIKPHGEYAESIDPIRNENMHKRALQSPEVKSNSQKLKHGMLILGGFICLLVIMYFGYKMMGKMDLTYNLVKTIAQSKGVIQ